MKTVDVVRFFGSKSKVAKELQLTKQAVGQWGEIVPELRQLQIELITSGQLRSEFTNSRLNKEGE